MCRNALFQYSVYKRVRYQITIFAALTAIVTL